jgi:hypothetical protein
VAWPPSIRSATASAWQQIPLAVRGTHGSVNSPGSARRAPARIAALDDAFQEQRVSVSADFGDVLAGVGVWRLEADDHRVVVRLAPGRIEDLHARERGDAGWSPAAGDADPVILMRLRARSGRTDADGAAPRRRRHGDDRVVRSEHVTSISPARNAGQLDTGPRGRARLARSRRDLAPLLARDDHRLHESVADALRT